jgi:hypothetical protein
VRIERTADRFNRAGKFGEDAVAVRLDDPPTAVRHRGSMPSGPAATTVMQFVSNRYFGCRYQLFILATAAGGGE